jgi:hypothetical protein
MCYMCYINTHIDYDEHNVIAVQYGGQMYYVTLGEINPGAEIYADYGPDYRRQLFGPTCLIK